ncbi:MAG: hypothetical protein KTR22_10295 [Flavobacteriaceae bacterium]|nr:hypothetical protein [Flavobacteriaceae bacterium]
MKTAKFTMALLIMSLFAFCLGCSPDVQENETESTANITTDINKKTGGSSTNFGGIAPNGAFYTNIIMVQYVPGTTKPERALVRQPYIDSGYLVDFEYCPEVKGKELWYVNHDCIPCRPHSGGTCKPTCDPDNNGDVGRMMFDGDCSS